MWWAEPPTTPKTMTTEHSCARFDDHVEHRREQDELTFAAFARGLDVGVPAPDFEATCLDDGAVVEVADLCRRRTW